VTLLAGAHRCLTLEGKRGAGPFSCRGKRRPTLIGIDVAQKIGGVFFCFGPERSTDGGEKRERKESREFLRGRGEPRRLWASSPVRGGELWGSFTKNAS